MAEIKIRTHTIDRTRGPIGPRTRTPEQQEYDTKALEIYEAWVVAGKPNMLVPVLAHPVNVVGKTSEQREAIVRAVEAKYRSAAKYLEKSYRSYGYDKSETSGHIDVLIGIVDARKNKPRKTQFETLPETPDQ
jgi:hypothetical protein